MKNSRHPHFWQFVTLVISLSLVLAACSPTTTAAPTAAATDVPTTVPTKEPTATSAPTATPEPAVTKVIADFEAAANLYDVDSTKASLGDVAYNGAASLKSESETGEWHTVGLTLDEPMDFSQYGKLCFFVYDTTSNNNGKALNTVGVKLFDSSGANVERYTDNEGVGENYKTKLNAWVPMCMNLVSFTGIDQTKVAKIEFTMYWAGVYYFDDITLLAQGDTLLVKEQPEETTGEGPVTTLVQGFEAEDTFYSDYQITTTLTTTTTHSGGSALMATYPTGEWHAFGAYPDPRPLDASKATKLCFWIMDMTANNDGKADNTVGVKLFDAAGANEEVWTDNALGGINPKTVTGEWVQMCINLDAYTSVDLSQLDKIQFAVYWAGTYFIDDIEIVSGAGAIQPVMFQGFEAEDTFYSDYQITTTLTTTTTHSGGSALMATYPTGEWHAFGAYPTTSPFDGSKFGKFCFWIMDTTTNNDGKADNTVGVKLFDAAGANEEVWTDNPLGGVNPKTVTGEWVQMCINLDAFTTVDISQIEKIQFAMYWAGTYFIDDIEFYGGSATAAAPLLVQGFEAEDTFYSDYQITTTLTTTTTHSGGSALMATYPTGEWHAFGAYPDPRPFDATPYGQVCFWIMDMTANNDGKADNTVGVKLFDATGANEEVWTDNALGGINPKTVTGEWVQMCINLDAYTSVDLSKLDKIQFAVYWAGTYFIDDIEFKP